MRKLLTSMVIALMFLPGTSIASAESLNGPISLETVYEGSDMSGSYTAPKAGTLTLALSSVENEALFSDSSHSNVINPTSTIGWNYDNNCFGTNEAYELTYALTDNQTVYFYYYNFFGDSIKAYFTFEEGPEIGGGGGAGDEYSIISMTPEAGNLTLPKEASELPQFVITMNQEFNYDSGRPPYWTIKNVSTGESAIGENEFTANSTVKNQFTTSSTIYGFVADNFVAGNKYIFTMTLDGGQTWIDGNTYTMVNADGSTEPETGEFEPLQTSYLSLGDQEIDTNEDPFTDFNWETSNGISGPSNCYVFTAQQNGSLAIYQTGTYDSHLYSVEWSKLNSFNEDNGRMGAEYSDDSFGYKLEYTLSEGNSYYFYAKTSNGDPLSSMYYEWTPSGSSADMPTAEIGSEFNCYKEMYKFTPDKTGIMTVFYSRFITPISSNAIIYTDPAMGGNNLKFISGDDEDNGYMVTYPVIAGQTYYFYQDEASDLMITIRSVEEDASVGQVAVTSVDPSTENVFDYVNNPEIKITASQAVTSFGTVTLTYGDQSVQLYPVVDGKNYYVTINGPYQAEWLQIGGDSATDFKALMAEVAEANPGTFKITVTDLYAGNEPVNAVSSSVEGVTVEDGTVTITYDIVPAPVYNAETSIWPNPFYAYWSEADKDEATATLNFSLPIASIGEAKLIMANVSQGAVGGETNQDSYTLEPVLSGNTVTIDFSGVPRTASTSTVTVVLSDVKGENGMTALFGNQPILYEHLAFVNENYGEPTEPEETEAQPIEPGTPFEVEALGEYNSGGYPLWVYTPSEDVANYYFTVADQDSNVFGTIIDGSDVIEPRLAFATDPKGENLVDLTPVKLSNGGYVYTGTDMEKDQSYYIILKDEYSYFNMELILQEYQASVAAPSITLDEEFTVSSDAREYTYSCLREEGNQSEELYFYLVTDSDTNLLKENGEFAIISPYGFDIFGEYGEVEAYPTDNGYVYANIQMDEGETYTFNYSGEEEITMTLYQGTYDGAPQSLGQAVITGESFTLDDQYAAVELTWGVEVEFVDADAISIPVLDMNDKVVGTLTSTYFQLQGAGAGEPGIPEDPNYPVVGSRAENGDKGTALFILAGAAATDKVAFTEVGTYFIEFPAGILMNADGALNAEQDIIIYVTEGNAVGEVEPAPDTDFAIGDEVEFTITYDEDVAIDETMPDVLMVYGGEEDYMLRLSGSDYSDYITVSGNKIVINLGSDLAKGIYQMTLFEGALIVGEDGMNAELEFNFTVGNPTGINSLYNIEGVEGIYNLQGVKVQNPAKGGIYIINGKKVLIK